MRMRKAFYLKSVEGDEDVRNHSGQMDKDSTQPGQPKHWQKDQNRTCHSPANSNKLESKCDFFTSNLLPLKYSCPHTFLFGNYFTKYRYILMCLKMFFLWNISALNPNQTWRWIYRFYSLQQSCSCSSAIIFSMVKRWPLFKSPLLSHCCTWGERLSF